MCAWNTTYTRSDSFWRSQVAPDYATKFLSRNRPACVTVQTGCWPIDVTTMLRAAASCDTIEKLILFQGVRDCPITDAFVELICASPHIHTLELLFTGEHRFKLTNAAFSALARSSVSSLRLSTLGTDTDANATALASSPALTALNVQDTNLTDAGLAALATSMSLTHLNLSGCCDVTNAGMGALFSSPVIQQIVVRDMMPHSISFDALSSARSCTSLVSLDLDWYDMDVYDTDVYDNYNDTENDIENENNIENDMENNIENENDIEIISYLPPSIQRLSLSAYNMFRLGTTALLHHLTYMDLSWTCVVDLRPVLACPSLTSLNLKKTYVGNDAIQAVAEHPSLTHLNIRDTRVTDAGLPALVRLTSLYISYQDTSVSDEGLAFLSTFQALCVLRVHTANAFTEDIAKHFGASSSLQTLDTGMARITWRSIQHLARCATLVDLVIHSNDPEVCDEIRYCPWITNTLHDA